MAGFEFSGVSGFESDIDALIAKVNEATRMGVVAGAALIEAEAKKRAPVKRGSLRRSINTISVTGGDGSYEARIAPTIIYGRRIELGYHGVDSLGRNYGPPNKGYGGHPYLRPAVDASGSEIVDIMQTWWASALGV